MPDAVVLAARAVLVAVLAVSAFAKLRDGRVTGTALVAFGLPQGPALTLWWLLPAVELAVATALLVALDQAWPAWAALVLLAAFTAATAANLLRGSRPPCPCFGMRQARPISGRTLVRNAALLAVAVLATG